MSEHAVFLVDANVFIEAKNRYYSFLICPGFWAAIQWHADSGALRSVDRVKRELIGGNDDLSDWARRVASPDTFLSTNDARVLEWYARIMSWVQGEPQFKKEAKDEFARAADPWLVACAGAYGMSLVTQESLDPLARKKVKIPNVCLQFGVSWMNTFEMLEDLRVRLDWQAPS